MMMKMVLSRQSLMQDISILRMPEHFHELYGSNESFAKLADYFVKTQWCPTAYDNREGMLAGNVQLSYTARSIITQLQLYTYTEGGE